MRERSSSVTTTTACRPKRAFAKFRIIGSQTAMRRTLRNATLSFVVIITTLCGFAQTHRDVKVFFREDIGLTEDQIANIQNGQAVVKLMPSRTPAEVFLLGAIYIHATPEAYVQFHNDFDRYRTLPSYLALGAFSNPPQPVDVKDLAFDGDDIKSLKNCKPGDCLIQMPATSIQELQQKIDWSAPNASEQVNQLLRTTALQFLETYQHDGNKMLGTYNDKRDPTDVAKQFAYTLSYPKALPTRLPEFYNYLLSYPDAKPAAVEDTFYWEKVKFGLKPTLRIVQLTTIRGKPDDDVAYAIAEKQLYSSHYFQTALDLSFCIRGDGPDRGFYLIMAMGSEQAGLTGLKGSIVRKVALGRSVSNLQNAMTNIRNTLEEEAHSSHTAW